MSSPLKLSPFSDVLADFRAGKMVIMVDDEKRENEGDVILAAEAVSEEALSFMMKEARGLICISVSVEQAERLNFPLQTLANNSIFQTPFAVSVDHKDVVSEGVTAKSRTWTMQKIVAGDSRASDFVSPGHVFPLIANPAGVLGRAGQTEGSFELSRLAGFKACGVLCEILNPDGTMARGAGLMDFAKRFNLKITSVADVIHYRINNEILVREVASAMLDTSQGEFLTRVFLDDVDGKEHIAVIYGEDVIKKGQAAPLVRIHSECLTGDVFGSRRCDCGEQLNRALAQIKEYGCGMVLYLRQEGRGIGLANKVKAYALQDQGSDTVEANVQLGFAADLRDYAVAAKILDSLGVGAIKLLTNNPEKLDTMRRCGINVQERVEIKVVPDEFNRHYLETKRTKLGHWL